MITQAAVVPAAVFTYLPVYFVGRMTPEHLPLEGKSDGDVIKHREVPILLLLRSDNQTAG